MNVILLYFITFIIGRNLYVLSIQLHSYIQVIFLAFFKKKLYLIGVIKKYSEYLNIQNLLH